MSSNTIALNANKRDVLGKQVRGLRNQGLTPAVIHDHGKPSIHISVEERELKKVFSEAGKHHPVQLTVDGKKLTTLIKEVTFKPSTNLAFHTVFQAVKANETVKAEIPVQLTGEIPAEKASLLVLQAITEVEVEALPKDLVDALEVDASSLVADGDSITVADIKTPNGVTILADPELAIATVETPKDQIAEADAAAAELAADAGEPSEAEEKVVEVTNDKDSESETKED